MKYFVNKWAFWFLMALKQLDKKVNGELHETEIYKFWPVGEKMNMDLFRSEIKHAQHVIIITGAGMSSPSGIPTFRGQGGTWRTFKSEDVASKKAFTECPSNVWEFFHYMRELMRTKEPNPGHIAIAEYQKRMISEGKKVTLVTQNIDGLHQKAGSPRVIEYHGNVFETRCWKCYKLRMNMSSPIVPSLLGREKFISKRNIPPPIPPEDLPRCQEPNCGGLLRPAAIWFGEDIPQAAIDETHEALQTCDFCLVIGTSSTVFPTAAYGPRLARKGVPVAEFNKKGTQFTQNFRFYFNGSCADTLPKALAPFD